MNGTTLPPSNAWICCSRISAITSSIRSTGFSIHWAPLIHAYEEEHVPIPEAEGSDVLEFLMEEHDLGPEDLPELGGAANMRAVLARERELHVGEIRALAERFRVSPAVFI